MTPAALHNLRLSLGLTQKALAHLIGVHPVTLSKWERGEIPIGGRAWRKFVEEEREKDQ